MFFHCILYQDLRLQTQFPFKHSSPVAFHASIVGPGREHCVLGNFFVTVTFAYDNNAVASDHNNSRWITQLADVLVICGLLCRIYGILGPFFSSSSTLSLLASS
jgi:hypothetical protein